MTTLTLVQNAGIAIDQAITLIISENRIDEAVEKLNEAKEIAVNAVIGFMMIAMASTILWILANLVGVDKFFST